MIREMKNPVDSLTEQELDFREDYEVRRDYEEKDRQKLPLSKRELALKEQDERQREEDKESNTMDMATQNRRPQNKRGH